MTKDEEIELRKLLIAAIKELGEIAECIIKEDKRPDHWKLELCDLCGLAIKPMIQLAGGDYDDACKVGLLRKTRKTETITTT